ncbi:MAG: hypothetical protein V1797_10610, partial [Pseudomonadota bacterium]
AQGLNWAAGTDAGKEIVDAIGDLKDPLKDIGQVTGAASSAWGLYKNIEGLASGEFNVKDVLGVAANTYGLTGNAAELLKGTELGNALSGVNGSLGLTGKLAGGALSAIGLVEGVRGLIEGEPQNPLSVIGMAKNAYDVYALGGNLLGGGEAAGAGGFSSALFGEAGMSTVGASAFAGVAMAPLAVIAAGQMLGALTKDYMTPQDARDLIASNQDFLGRAGDSPMGLMDAGLSEAERLRLRPDVAESINTMEKLSDRAGYSLDYVHGMSVDAMGWMGPAAVNAANRMEAMDAIYAPDTLARMSDPDNFWERQQGIEGAYTIAAQYGMDRQGMDEMTAQLNPLGDMDQLEAMVAVLKDLAATVTTASTGMGDLLGSFTEIGAQMGLSAEQVQPFSEQVMVLANQLSAGQIGVDGFAAGVQAIAGGLGLSSEQGAALVQALLGLLGPLAQGGQAAALMGGGVGGAADALARAGGAAGDLIGHAAVMPNAFGAGGAAAAAAGGVIAAGLNPALADAAAQAQLAADEAAAMAGAIQGIPTEWNSNLYFTRYYTTVGNPFHAGGQVLHDGGLAGAARYHDGGWLDELLKPYEVPAVLKQGEFVVRSESVTADTLPWLQAVNRGGSLPDSGGVTINVQAPLVQVQGGLPQNPDALEDLARLIQDRLIDLAERRYGAGW